MVPPMNLSGWLHLKQKNLVLVHKMKGLMQENEEYRLMNAAFEIENFDAGRRIARLKSDQESLIQAYNQLKGNLVTGHQLIDGQPPEIDKIVGSLEDTPGIITIGDQSLNPDIKEDA